MDGGSMIVDKPAVRLEYITTPMRRAPHGAALTSRTRYDHVATRSPSPYLHPASLMALFPSLGLLGALKSAIGTPSGLLGASFAAFGGPWLRLEDPWLPLGAYWELVNVFCVLLKGLSRHHRWLFALL